MHPGPQVRLGHDQGGGGLEIALEFRGEERGLAGPAQDGQFVVPQHAEARIVPVSGLLRRIVAIGQARIFIDPRAEENEMLLAQPAKVVEILIHRFRRRARRPGPAGLEPALQGRTVGRQGLLQLLGGLPEQIAHGLEIGDGLADVRKRRGDPGDHGVPAILAHGGHGDDDDGFPAALALRRPATGAVPSRGDHGVEHRPDVKTAVGQLTHHAVHEEGRVGLGDHEEVKPERLSRRPHSRGQADHRFAIQMVGRGPGLHQPCRQIGHCDPRQFIGTGVVEGLAYKVLLRR